MTKKAEVTVSSTMTSKQLSELFTKERDLQSRKTLATELPETLSVFKHSEDRIVFACEPWGPGTATLLAAYEFGTRSGSYKIRPEFFVGGGIATTRAASVVMLDRSFFEVSLSEFLAEVEKGISESSCVISSEASCPAASNMRLEFRGHSMIRTYKATEVLYIIDRDVDVEVSEKVFTISPATEGKECIVRYPLDEEVTGIVTEMVKIS